MSQAAPRTAPAWKLLHAAHRVNREQNSKAWRFLIDALETDDLPADLIETGLREQFAFERSDHGLIRIAHESDGIATAGVQPEQYGYLLYGKTQRELDTLFDSLGADWVNKRVRELQARYPAEAAEMGLAALVQAAPAAGGNKPEAGYANSQPRKYVKKAEAECIAREKYKELWRHDNASHWAREIGCDPRAVKMLTVWNDAAQKRQKRSTAANKLRAVVDPKIVEALLTGDASLIDSLSDTDREKWDALSDANRQEILRELEESAAED